MTTAAVAALVALTACDSDPMAEDAPEIVETTESADEVETAAEQTEEPAETEPGTRDNPLPLGTVAVLGDYEVAVTEIALDADELVAASNEFNEPAEAGQYVLVTLEGTFVGGGETPEGNPGLDLSAVIVGGDAKQYADFDAFAMPPDPLIESPTLGAGGTFTGNVVLDIPADALDGAALFVEPLISFDNDSRSFWALP